MKLTAPHFVAAPGDTGDTGPHPNIVMLQLLLGKQ
jgi:hypothetical protein